MAGFRLADQRRVRSFRILLRLAIPIVLIAALYESGVLNALHKRSATVVISQATQAVQAALSFDTSTSSNSSSSSGGGIGGLPTLLPGSGGDGGTPWMSKAQAKQRCSLAKGDWCEGYFLQTPIASKQPPAANKTCLWGCNFVGVCDHYSGWCRCPAGWIGDDCSTRQRRPCSQMARPHGFEPYDAPNNFSRPSGLDSRCAQLCDQDIGYCFCNSTWKYGHELAPPDAPPGTPLRRRGRPLGMHCQPNKNDRGEAMAWGDREPADLWGPEGWCVADKPSTACPCILDGYAGPFCDQYREPFCLNQCSGHGECQLGFCKCHEGYWGQDCAQRVDGAALEAGMEAGERPWLGAVVEAAAAAAVEAGAARLRPLIYVYELPSIFNQKMLQYRVDHGTCVHRLFDEANNTVFIDGWPYGLESGLHEALLQSRHRTFDPDEADYFYIPVHATCYLYPIHGLADFPFFHSFHNIPRVHGAINMLIEVHAWIRSHHPWWDRRGGADHIIVQTHDEGSCWLPAVLRPAVLLTHWGRLGAGHTSNTGYGPDRYDFVVRHPVYMPEGIEGKLGNFACYDPVKDLVVPPLASADKHSSSPMVGAPARKRHILGFFKGRTQQGNAPYSRGIRQKLENLCRDNDWWAKHKIWLGEGNPPGEDHSYSQLLASSNFCFALPGDGFSARFEDGIHHGCIPVIIQDGVHLAFESLFEFDRISVRIAQKDMERVPQILRAIQPDRVAAMQRAIGQVWRKWSYSGIRPYAKRVQELQELHKKQMLKGGGAEHASLPAPERDYDPRSGDALEVIYAWLYSRIPFTRQPSAAVMETLGLALEQQQGTARRMPEIHQAKPILPVVQQGGRQAQQQEQQQRGGQAQQQEQQQGGGQEQQLEQQQGNGQAQQQEQQQGDGQAQQQEQQQGDGQAQQQEQQQGDGQAQQQEQQQGDGQVQQQEQQPEQQEQQPQRQEQQQRRAQGKQHPEAERQNIAEQEAAEQRQAASAGQRAAAQQAHSEAAAGQQQEHEPEQAAQLHQGAQGPHQRPAKAGPPS